MVTTQLTNVEHDAIQIGMLVEMVNRKMRDDGKERGMVVYGYKYLYTDIPHWLICKHEVFKSTLSGENHFP